MTKDYAYVLNRELLGPSGLLLSDEDYVRVIEIREVEGLLQTKKIIDAYLE